MGFHFEYRSKKFIPTISNKMKIILVVALSLIAASEAQPWGYHINSFHPGYYHPYPPVVYHTPYVGYYHPFAWNYGVTVDHAQGKGHVAPAKPKMEDEDKEEDYDFSELGSRTDVISK